MITWTSSLGSPSNPKAVNLAGSSHVVLKKRERPPEKFFQEAIASGKVFPDETEPYDAASFHGNFRGYELGHKDQAARQAWFAKMNDKLASYKSWDAVDIHQVDADYAMKYGDHALGSPFPYNALKPLLQSEKEKMVLAYAEALNKIRAKEEEAWIELTSNPKYNSYAEISKGRKPLQPVDTLDGIFKGCLQVVEELWNVTEDIAQAAGSSDYSWSIKKLSRTTKKVFEKYGGHPNEVTDILRTSVVVSTIGGIIIAFDSALFNSKIVRIKNRFNTPELGYSDVLLNLEMSNGFLVEIQLHLASVCNVKDRSGHRAFKWFRRLMQDNDTYDGERNTEGERHGHGKWMGANGDVYMGLWLLDKKNGQGTYTEADGHTYIGSFVDDKREGSCVFTYYDGSKYVGTYWQDKKDGYGTFTYADGQKYVGSWAKGKRHGTGTFVYTDGSKYEGKWSSHKRDGRGAFTPAGEEVGQVGYWIDDQEASHTAYFLHFIGCALNCVACSSGTVNQTVET